MISVGVMKAKSAIGIRARRKIATNPPQEERGQEQPPARSTPRRSARPNGTGPPSARAKVVEPATSPTTKAQQADAGPDVDEAEAERRGAMGGPGTTRGAQHGRADTAAKTDRSAP